MSHDVYESPLAGRYASPYMLHLFSPDMRFQTWRRLWTALARAQHQLGLPVTEEQVRQLEQHIPISTMTPPAGGRRKSATT